MNSFDCLIAQLERQITDRSDVELEISEPARPEGAWIAALHSPDGYTVECEWRQHRGFGLVAGREFQPFSGVDEIYATWRGAADRMIELWDARAETSADLAVPVAELRKLRGQLQKDVAEQMGITKGGLAQIEASAAEGKVQVDTLGRLIAALGGRLVISATFPDGSERKVAVGH